MSKKIHRLFEQFQPERYDITLRPDSKSKTFTGTIRLFGKKNGRPSHRITLHQKALNINSANIIKHDKKGSQAIAVNRINLHNSFNELRLHTVDRLFSGHYTITLEFSGKITDAMQGIYLCTFQHNKIEKSLVATQFESNHAREAFPCIDEPQAKAVFQLTLISPKGEVALSNTPILKQSSSKYLCTTTFEETPKMSTYLLAFVTGQMHCVQKNTKDGVMVRGWATVSQPKSHLRYCVDEGVKLLEFYTDFFGVSYPLKKCDQVALPDFDAGAMENWGLITYREIALLIDPDNRSISSEQYVSLVVAHELSHQWFGNLVTMKWWDDLWLNESFASFMEHLALDAIHPDWNQWELYTASDIITTSNRDVYSNIQPVGVEVKDPDLLETLFDPGIVYAKGGRLLKMLREYIGDKKFTDGLKLYFERHAYSNADRSDLWRALAETSGKDITNLMTPWLTQAGMPMVSVKQKDKNLSLSQKRFLLDKHKDENLWPIPLLANTKLKPDIFETKRSDISLESSNYVLLNQHASSHYIAYYTEPEHREYLSKMLQKLTMPTEARINILNDALLLSRHGDSELTNALDIIKSCSEEPRDSVWALIGRVLGATSQLIEGRKESEANLKIFKAVMAKHWYNKLGWEDQENDDSNTRQLRHSMIALTIAAEATEAINEAKRQFKIAKHYKDINAELRPTILAVMVRYGSNTVVKQLLKDYPAANADLQLDITSALASTKDSILTKEILDAAIGSNGFVRSQDIMRWLALFLRNQYIRSATWKYMEDNWKRLESVLSQSKSFDYLPVICASAISTEEWSKKYKKFFEPKKTNKVLQQNIQVGFSDIDARVAWRNRNENSLVSWLSKQVKNKD